MLLNDLNTSLSNEKLEIDILTVSTPKIKTVYSKNLPSFNNQFIISKARYANECLFISVGNNSYYILEANVLYRKHISIIKQKYFKKFLFFKIPHYNYITNEDDVIACMESTKLEYEKKTNNYLIDYKKYFDANNDNVFYYFVLKTYFIVNKDEITEISYNDLKIIKRNYHVRVNKKKQKRIENNINRILNKK